MDQLNIVLRVEGGGEGEVGEQKNHKLENVQGVLARIVHAWVSSDSEISPVDVVAPCL